ncbi:MAG: alpha/beta hydrolase [Rhodobacteraceae bacterium]|nr:alpha/beta hydrolase [Paracoccaceae bacterium]
MTAALLLLARPAGAQDMAERLAALGGQPCALSSLTCVTIDVPRDPVAGDPGGTLPVTFAVSPAKTASRGVLVIVVGGPGGSGLAVADDYMGAFDAELTAQVDIVFFDQRGTGPDTGLVCPEAQGRYDTADVPLDRPEAAISITKQYVSDCLSQLDHADLLGLVDSDRAIRDLEVFRQAIGAPRLWLYGESYGTQFVQQYATLHPDAVAGVILDGVVDLTLSLRDYYAAYTEASERILERVFATCDRDPDCAADMDAPSAEVYDRLAARLAAAPATVDFPLGSGGTSRRDLTAAILENNAFYALYGPNARTTFLRALAAAGRGEYLPMLRLGYSNLYLDSETGQGIADPSWFGAAYFAVTCTDYAEGAGDADALAAAIIREAQDFGAGKRLARAYFAERLVCAYWPFRGRGTRPAPFAGGDYQTLILNADTDPITPVSMSYAVMDGVRNGHLVVMQGGPHVIWGRGLACPDRIVSALILEGKVPDAPTQLCAQDFTDPYVPLSGGDPSDPLAVAQDVETELDWYPEIYNWDLADRLRLGCDFGGTITADAGETETSFAFGDCGLWPGTRIDGTAQRTEAGKGSDGLVLDLEVSGRHGGTIRYARSADTESWSVSGVWDGVAFDTPRPLP